MADTGDLFQFTKQDIKHPFTADRATLTWGDQGPVNFAINVQISYQQQLQRRRVIGNKWAIRYGSQPQGQITCQRILASGDPNIYTGDIWNQCKVGKDVVVSLADCENGKGHTYTCTGATVTQFTLSIEAESLT